MNLRLVSRLWAMLACLAIMVAVQAARAQGIRKEAERAGTEAGVAAAEGFRRIILGE